MTDSMQNRFKHLVGVLGVVVLAALWVMAAQTPELVVPSGTRLRVQFQTPVGSAISRAGDGVEVWLLKRVLARGRKGITEVLPAGTVLTGRVLNARPGSKRTRTFPMLRLKFDRLTLPDGRSLPVAASLADLGILLAVDSEGAAMPKEATTEERVAGVAGAGGIGAGIGGMAGGGKGAATGAGIGAGIGVLMDLATRGIEYEDFTLKKGRAAWLRLDADLQIPQPPAGAAGKSENSPNE
jgi:hypothetical protein